MTPKVTAMTTPPAAPVNHYMHQQLIVLFLLWLFSLQPWSSLFWEGKNNNLGDTHTIFSLRILMFRTRTGIFKEMRTHLIEESVSAKEAGRTRLMTQKSKAEFESSNR